MEIRKYRWILYDTSMKKFKDIQRETNCWEEIAQTVGKLFSFMLE